MNEKNVMKEKNVIEGKIVVKAKNVTFVLNKNKNKDVMKGNN